MKNEITLKVKPGRWGELAKIAENLRKAGIRSGCFAYLFAALIVCALLAAIPLLMALLGWLTGGAQQ